MLVLGPNSKFALFFSPCSKLNVLQCWIKLLSIQSWVKLWKCDAHPHTHTLCPPCGAREHPLRWLQIISQWLIWGNDKWLIYDWFTSCCYTWRLQALHHVTFTRLGHRRGAWNNFRSDGSQSTEMFTNSTCGPFLFPLLTRLTGIHSKLNLTKHNMWKQAKKVKTCQQACLI